MKKTVSLLLAVIIAAVAFCTLAVSAFADDPADDPNDVRNTTTTTTTTATTTTTTAAATTTTTTAAAETTTTTTKAADDATTTTAAATTKEDVTVTRKPGETVIDEGDTKAPSTTKKPASVDSAIPSTGSSIAVPAIALLALAAGTIAVVKTKKDN